MLILYYKIWVDLIVRAKSVPANRENWKVMTLLYMSMLMAINLIVIMTIIQKYFGLYVYDISFSIMPGIIESFVKFCILFFLPSAVLNYLLIFWNNRYNKIIQAYSHHNGKLFISYALLSLSVPLIALYFMLALKYNIFSPTGAGM